MNHTDKNLKELPDFKQYVKVTTKDIKKKLQYDCKDENDIILNNKEEWCINYSEIAPHTSPESVLINGKKKYLKYINEKSNQSKMMTLFYMNLNFFFFI